MIFNLSEISSDNLLLEENKSKTGCFIFGKLSLLLVWMYPIHVFLPFKTCMVFEKAVL